MKKVRKYTVVISLSLMALYFAGKEGYKEYYSKKEKVTISISINS